MKTTKGMRVATVWKLCIEMWDWIAEMIRAGDERNIDDLKDVWCEQYGYELEMSCFFCDKAEGYCEQCQGTTIDPTFMCHGESTYHYYTDPLKFHAKLHRMNDKRLKMNREKRSA